MKYIHRFFRKTLTRNIFCVSIGIICLVCLLCFCRPLYVNGVSMEPTIADGQFLAIQPTAHNPFVTAQPGDIVVVRTQDHKLLIKRLIAGPGDTLAIRSNQVYVNGAPLEESYLGEAMVTADVAPFTLEDNAYYVLGDNRNVSADSRYFGLFSKSDIFAVVNLDRQLPLWIAIAVLILNFFLWLVYLPDWDSPMPKTSTATTPCDSSL